MPQLFVADGMWRYSPISSGIDGGCRRQATSMAIECSCSATHQPAQGGVTVRRGAARESHHREMAISEGNGRSGN